MKWNNYKQAADLPPHVVERMWRALDRIASGANPALKAGYADYMSKADIAAAAKMGVIELEVNEPKETTRFRLTPKGRDYLRERKIEPWD